MVVCSCSCRAAILQHRPIAMGPSLTSVVHWWVFQRMDFRRWWSSAAQACFSCRIWTLPTLPLANASLRGRAQTYIQSPQAVITAWHALSRMKERITSNLVCHYASPCLPLCLTQNPSQNHTKSLSLKPSNPIPEDLLVPISCAR